MRKQTRAFFVLCVLMVVVVVCFLVAKNIESYMAKARASEAKTILASWATAQNAFHDEYKEYSNDPAKIGFSTEGKLRGKLYTSQEELPADIAQRLPKGLTPIVTKDAYLVLYVMHEKGEMQVFSIDQSKTIRQIELK